MQDFYAEQRLSQLNFRRDIEQFNSNLQKGDLGLSKIIDNGFILYGQTRAGKTATGHILSGNPLKGAKIAGQQMVQATTSRNKKAKIGNAMNSETLIPNFFQVKLKYNENNNQYLEGNTYVVDTPGYGDTYGVLRILANGYYHYRLYSKVKNMKFILCFDAISLKNTGQAFIETIIQFTSSFKNYLGVRKQIWKSCAFLFTKVDQKQYSLDDLIQKLKSMVINVRTQYDKDVQDALRQFITYIIDQKRIFYIKKIKKGDTATSGDLLQQINKKVTNWWKRQFDQEKQIMDMEPVLFSLSQQIIVSTTTSNKFRKQFAQLIQYYNIRIKQFVQQAIDTMNDDKSRCSLSYVIHELVDDAMGHPDSHKFLDKMSQYVDIYYSKYDPVYKEDRQKRQKQMFSIENDNSLTQKSQPKYKTKDKNYLVKKFKTLKRIQQLKQQISDFEFDQRNLDWLQTCQNNLFQIIREFNRISYKRNKSVQVIYKYGYLIHRIVQQAKIFLLLIQISSSKQNIKRIKQTAGGQFIDLMRLLKDFMGLPYRYNNGDCLYQDLHLQFVKQFNLNDDNYKSININQNLIQFFSQINIVDDQDSQKLTQLVLKYSDKILKQSQDQLSIGTKQANKLIQRLTTARITCDTSFALKQDPQQKKIIMFIIRKTSKNLGKLLQLMGKYQIARKVYDSIKFADCVCKMFKTQIQELRKIKQDDEQNRKKQFQLRMQYSRYLAEHFRQNESIQVLQQTFELADNMQELIEVKDEMSNLKLRMRDINHATDYEKNLFNDQYFEPFSEQFGEQIISLTQNLQFE